MNDLISLIPEVTGLHLRNIGPWTDARFAFAPQLNVIRGRGACGKTIALSSLLPQRQEWLTARAGTTSGEVRVEYARRGFTYAVPEISATTEPEELSYGEHLFQSLDHALGRARSGSCLVVDEEVFTFFGDEHCGQVIGTLSSAECQCILAVPHDLPPEYVLPARWFDCAIGSTGLATVQMRDL